MSQADDSLAMLRSIDARLRRLETDLFGESADGQAPLDVLREQLGSLVCKGVLAVKEERGCRWYALATDVLVQAADEPVAVEGSWNSI